MNLQQNTATPDWVEACFRKGLITEEQRNAALDKLNPHDHWRLWIGRMLSAIGGCLILSAILYFYAFNWAKITPMMKLGSAELAIAVCFIAALLLDTAKPAGQYLLTAAAFLVGVFLAVFGQIYQTGADAYQLFVAWAVFIAGWTVLARFAPLWGLWLVIVNVGLALYLKQEMDYDAPLRHWEGALFMALNLPFLLLGESLLKNGSTWLDAQWLRMGLLSIITLNASLTVGMWIFWNSSYGLEVSMQALLSTVVLGGLLYLYRIVIPNIRALSLVVFSLGILFICQIFDAWPLRAESAMLLGGFVVLGVFSLMMRYLRKAAKAMEASHV